jgi:hypothetical protein
MTSELEDLNVEPVFKRVESELTTRRKIIIFFLGFFMGIIVFSLGLILFLSYQTKDFAIACVTMEEYEQLKNIIRKFRKL